MADFNEMLIEDLRAHGGQATSGPFVGRPMIIITTTGAKTGKPRTTPLVYTRHGDGYVIVASKGGSDTDPAWYRNILANPSVTVEVDGQTFRAHARVTDEAERQQLYERHADVHPSFHDYVKKTSRVIPVIVLEREASAAA
jgi:deazaflavin-dependent oxidoreductase (nitroreductase family)